MNSIGGWVFVVNVTLGVGDFWRMGEGERGTTLSHCHPLISKNAPNLYTTEKRIGDRGEGGLLKNQIICATNKNSPPRLTRGGRGLVQLWGMAYSNVLRNKG